MSKLHKINPSLHLDMWAHVMTHSFFFFNLLQKQNKTKHHALGFKTMKVLCACLCGQTNRGAEL